MTGQDILQAEFEKSGIRGGYKSEQVDEFLNNIAKFVDSQENDKGELEYKIKILAEKIEQYKREEDNMKEALIGAQTHGKRVVEEAKAKAEDMIKQTEQACEKSLNEAKKKADLLTETSLNKAKSELSEIQRDCSRERELLEKLKSETSKFRKSLLDQYKAHIAAVQNLPSLLDQSYGVQSNTQKSASTTENKAKQILREEENKVAPKEKIIESKPKQERVNSEPKPKSRHTQVPKNRLLEEEESKLEKSKTLEFDSENINISSMAQPIPQQTQQLQQIPATSPAPQSPPPATITKQEPEKVRNAPANNHNQNRRPDYLKKFGELELEFGKNKGK